MFHHPSQLEELNGAFAVAILVDDSPPASMLHRRCASKPLCARGSPELPSDARFSPYDACNAGAGEPWPGALCVNGLPAGVKSRGAHRLKQRSQLLAYSLELSSHRCATWMVTALLCIGIVCRAACHSSCLVYVYLQISKSAFW